MPVGRECSLTMLRVRNLQDETVKAAFLLGKKRTKKAMLFHVFLHSSDFSLFGLTRMMATKSSMRSLAIDSADARKKTFVLSRIPRVQITGACLVPC